MNEHYCRKWIAIKNLKELKENETLLAQISHYKDSGKLFGTFYLS
jgi:hypothetical protein